MSDTIGMGESLGDLADDAPCGLFSTTMDGVVLTANRTLLSWLGLPREQLMGTPFPDLLAMGDRMFYETRFIPALRINGAVDEVVLSLRRVQGRPLPVILSADVRRTASGDSRIRAAVFNRTRQVADERALMEATRAVAAAEEHVRTLEDAATLFAQATTLDALAAGLATIAQTAFSAAATAVLVRDSADRLVLAAGTHPLEEALAEQSATPEWDALRRREVIVISSLDEADALYPGLGSRLHKARIASMTATPILNDEDSLGVLVCFFRRRGVLPAALLTFQQALARQVAQVMRRISLEEEQRREHDAASDLWMKMQQLSARLRSETKPRNAVEIVAAGVGEALRTDAVNIFILPDRDLPRIDLRWTPESLTESPEGSVTDLHSRALALWSMHSARHLEPSPGGTEIDETSSRWFSESIDGSLSTPAIVIPLGAGEKVVGILVVRSSDPGRVWTPFEHALVQSTATDLAHHLLQASLLIAQTKTVQRLRELDQEKSDLIATVNHELRTPLAAITGYAELLTEQFEGKGESKTLAMLQTVQRNAARLEVLIERMMAVATTDSSAAVQLDSADLSDLLRSVAQSLAPLAAERDIAIVLDADGPLPIFADVTGIEQVFVNVVHNAVKFSSPAATVTIAARTIEEHGMPRIMVTVSDTGIGISDSDIPRVGMRLFRGANAIVGAFPGSGLGVSIAKKILGASGGHMEIASQLGKGTQVYVTIPAAYTPRESRAHADSS